MGRIVLVLGQDPALDVEPIIRKAWKENLELVVLNLGWVPLSSGQKKICDAALEAAGRGLVWLEEKIIADPADIPGLLREDDIVYLALSLLEQKRMETTGRERPGPSTKEAG